jgi:glycosyltransferase involved in cell wall biosynthesis
MSNQAGRVAVCTIASKNYLARARVLAQSFRCYHPDVPVFLLLVDKIDGYFDPAQEPFTTLALEEIGIDDLAGLCFQYPCQELNTAVKPFLLEYLLRENGFAKVLYFDPDIKFYDNLAPLFSALDDASFILTPHLTAPLTDELRQSERDIMMAGDYNLGFIGIANTPTTERMLSWWQERMRKYCVFNINWGYFVDQKWIDLVPGMFGETTIIRDPAYNVAFWNFQHRLLACADGKYFVNGQPLRFFHFSGLRLGNEEEISRQQTRYLLHDLPCLPELYDEYKAELMAAGQAQVEVWPYSFETFDNGVPIPPLAREVYLLMGRERADFGDPFRTGPPDSYYEWLNEPVIGSGTTPPIITNLAYEIYRRRTDLQRIYPQVIGQNRSDVAGWVLQHGQPDFAFAAPFLAALQAGKAPEAGMPIGRRGNLVSSLAHLGIGRIARRLLGAQLKNRLRDRLLWGERAATTQDWRRPPLRQRVKSDPFGANVIGYLYSESGVGESSRTMARVLQAAQVPVVGVSLDLYCGHRTRAVPPLAVGTENPYAFNLFCVNADVSPEMFTQLGPAFSQNKCNIGYWFWELEAFPDSWRPAFDYLDEVWVASSFTRDCVKRVTSLPVTKIPLAIEPAPAGPPPPQVADLPADTFVFLFIFDYYSHPDRKNPLAVLRAFQQAFPNEPDVHLVLKGTDSRANPGYHNRLVSEISNGRVTIIDSYLDTPVVQGLLARCDCYVSLHRSEGFGLTMAEAMYLGKPVIATAYSANLDFMRPENSYLVPYTMLEIDRDHGPYKKGWQWADPDIATAAQYMRQVYEDRAAAARIGAAGAQTIHSEFSAAAVGAMVKARLEKLRG